jgi:acyl-coenzyme A synthetase/AMP-(fatty) acid ligase
MLRPLGPIALHWTDAYPNEIEFGEATPKTPSGKIQRFVLRTQKMAKGRLASG